VEQSARLSGEKSPVRIRSSPLPVMEGRTTDRNGHLAKTSRGRNDRPIEKAVITRDEVVALLFNVSDIVASLERIEDLLEEADGEEDDEG
jgi:hypothetical protein